MASINDIGQQYAEMRQGLKQLGVELELYWPNPNDIPFHEDRSVSTIAEEDETEEQSENEAEEDPKDKDMDVCDMNESNVAESGSMKDIQVNKDAESSHITQLEDNNVERNNNIEPDHESNHELNHESNYNEVKSPDQETQIVKEEEEDEAERWMGQDILGSRDRFMQVMEEFRNSANNRFEELEALYVNVDVKWRDIMLYYGESPKTTRPDEFFQIFACFVQSWKLAAVEELKYSESLEREERRKQALEDKNKDFSTTKPSSTVEISDSESQSSRTSHEDHDRRIMDDLMEQLRSGKAENKMRQRRVRERLRRIKNEEDPMKPVAAATTTSTLPAAAAADKNRTAALSVVMSRTDSTQSGQMPVISAEDLLRSLQQETESIE